VTVNFRDVSEHLVSSMHIKAETVFSQTSYWTNGVGFVFGALTFNQWMMLATFLLGVSTFAVNSFYQRRRDRRELEFHRLRMEAQDKMIKQAGSDK